MRCTKDKPCSSASCNVTTGTPVSVSGGSTTAGVDFAVVKGGTITGTVTDGTTFAGISGVTVGAYDASGRQVAIGTTTAAGVYTLSGVPTGTHYLRTSPGFVQFKGGCCTVGGQYIHELYNDKPCPHGLCTVTTGTGVSVTAGQTTSGINFALALGGSITGFVTDAATNRAMRGFTVSVYDAVGTLVDSYCYCSSIELSGFHRAEGLATGTYFVRVSAAGYVFAIYDGQRCPGNSCPVTTGTPVSVVAGVETSGINVALQAGGVIAGTVTDAGTSAPLGGVTIKAYDTSGTEMASSATDQAGQFAVGLYGINGGLTTGTYFVRTSGTAGYLDQLYKGRLCVNDACLPAVTTGTGVVVREEDTTHGIDFGLPRRGIELSPSRLRFGALKAGTAGVLSAVTAPQAVAVAFSDAAGAWTVVADQPWVQITNAAGTGPGRFTVSVINPGNVIGDSRSLSATLTVTSGSLGLTTVLPVTLTVQGPEAAVAPFGSFDTPGNGASVAGSIAVTGWALDDIGIDRVEIWRDRVPGETTPGYAGSGPGNGKVFIANAVFVSGARPDLEAAYPTNPQVSQAGWGYLMLTQGLWNQGNGPFTLYAFAYDLDGHSTTLGSKAITVSNATATKPFGALDTPSYGQMVTASFWNFGWALTPNATPGCRIGPAGVQVGIDSGPLLPVAYGDLRTDIAAAFPGFTNGDGAGGSSYIDTTTLTNGTHQNRLVRDR